MPVRCKRVWDPVEEQDGLRVLVTYYWPRGLARSAVDRWYRALGTPPALLRPWQEGRLSREQFEAAYRTALETPEARELLRELARQSLQGTVTLLTSFRDLERSHVWILKDIIEGLQAASPPAT